jgi:hypothetical protein
MFVLAVVSLCTGVSAQPVAERGAIRLVESPNVTAIAVLLVQFTVGRIPVVTPTPPVPVITFHQDVSLRQSPLTVATFIGTFDGIAPTPLSVSTGEPSTSLGGTFETPAQPPVAEVWLRSDTDWLDKNMLLWMDRHPVLLKQP